MRRYRIGRIEGRWENLIPPIQLEISGKGEIVDPVTKDDDSPEENGSPMYRHRCTGSGTLDSAASGVSSNGDDSMAHLDAVTREKINLDLETYPALDAATQDAIVAKYRHLYGRIVAEGLFECNYSAYGIELCRYSVLFGLMLLFLHWGWYVTSAVFMGIFWHQMSFSAHDAGHIGITHNYQVDSVLGIVIADFIGGMSMGWWKRNHNIHHIVTNFPEHDPDIEYLPFLAVSHRFLAGLRSSYYDRMMEYDTVAKFLVGFQKYLYYPLLTFGRFNLYVLSWAYLLGGQAPCKGPSWWHWYLELAGQVFYWIWYGYGVLGSIPTIRGRILFFLISHMVVAPLHVQLTLSHFAMSTADLGPQESFPQKMLRTTMDVDCPPWLDFFHGGLQFQVIHHLFPRVPRHNLRRVQKLVREFCVEVDIPYALYGFVDSNKQVVGSLAEVSRQAAILAKCQQVMMAESGKGVNGH